MRKHFIGIVLLTLSATGFSQIPSAIEPVTPSAAPEARALLNAISRLSGRNTLSGQRNFSET